jgi:hypothetical protein
LLLQCTSESGVRYALAVELREDIVPEKSKCKKALNSQQCTFVKQEPHRFDRLTRIANALEGHVKVGTDGMVD